MAVNLRRHCRVAQLLNETSAPASIRQHPTTLNVGLQGRGSQLVVYYVVAG
ncbi:hypothetical protein J6590_017491 [Homalodisca vitripennis]|nr:hypothetical protein J6590_017491 [Homalodisca vitripennis]